MDVTEALTGSSRPSPRKVAAARSRAATRQRLLDSALELFARDGLHGVTTHDIAARAGVAAGPFYLHFHDKREIFRELAQTSLAVLKQRIESDVRPDDEPESAVRALAIALTGFALENRELMRMVFSSDGDAAAVESDILDDFAAWVDARRRAVADDVDPDLDPTVLSQALVGMWARVLKWWVEDPARVSREKLIRTLCRIQLSGTNPTEPARQEPIRNV
jgi:AcrR family transcriptional regulator